MTTLRDDIETDLAVVGGGGAGLAATVEAARRGLKVVLLEKAEKLGGTTALSVGSIMAAGTPAQQRAGVKDSPQAHAEDLDRIRTAMGVDDDAELRRVLTENVADTIAFLQEFGLNFLGPLPQPPHSAPRLHQVMPTSPAYIFQLGRHAGRLGVDVRLGAPATKLLMQDGRIAAVEAQTRDGLIRVKTRAGVVLASGDIGGDTTMMHAHMKNWIEGIEVYNPNNTGDGHKLAAAIGARIVSRRDLGAEHAAHLRFVRPKPMWLQRIPAYPPLTRAMVWAMRALPRQMIRPLMMKFLITTLGPDRGVYEHGAILVNKYGERFADELGGPNLKVPGQPDGVAYLVFDHRFAQKFSRWPHFISTAPGVAFAFVDDYRLARPDLFHVGETPDHLANAIGFSGQMLKVAIAGANAGRPDELKLVMPPFYALGPIKLWVMVAPIGLAVNTHFEVLNEAGQPIPGLYAAGNAGQAGFTVTGHGHGLGWAFTSGRLAARNAAAAVSQPRDRTSSPA
jgi:succinate dehydrogenase/fumarate reductase flavoprotein subunit